MSHLDEGTLHALLDGELELHEVREIQAHLGSCTACDSRLQAAKEVYGEADRLVASVQFPGSPRAGVAGAHAAEDVLSPPAPSASPPRRERRIEERPVYEEDVPQVVILPEENLWPERRRRLLVAARWAAVLLVAVGAGFLASEVRKNANPEVLRLDRAPAAVLSPEETVGPEGAAERQVGSFATGARRDSVAAAASPPPARQSQEARKAAPPPAPEPDVSTQAAAEEDDVAAQDEATSLADADTSAPAVRNEESPADQPEPAATQEDIRAEAAEALAELDQQRRRERAAAATQEIDRERRRLEAARVTTAPASAPPPAPRTLEQRSGIYLRIGLDEAARQLGRPVHVIEGLNAQFMGLVQGRQASGADTGRPAVRVVYQDSQGRMILLDQQRLRPGQSWPSGATQWTMGEVGLYLHGEASSEVLRNLRPRVR